MSLNSISQFYDVDSDTEKECSDSDKTTDLINDTLDVIKCTGGVIKDGGKHYDSPAQPIKSSDKIIQAKEKNPVEICEGEKETLLTDNVPSPERSPPKLEVSLVRSLLSSYVEGQITKEESLAKDAVEGGPSSTNKNEDAKMDMSRLWPFTHCKIILCRGPFDEKEESSQGWTWEGKHFVYFDRIMSIKESNDLGNKLDQTLLEIKPESPVLKPSPVPEVKLEQVPETLQNDQSKETLPSKRKLPAKRGRPKGQKNKQKTSRPSPKRKEIKQDIEDEPSLMINEQSNNSPRQTEVNREPLPSSSSAKSPQVGTPNKPVPLRKRRKKSPPPPISIEEETDSPARLTRSSRKRRFPSPPPQTLSGTIAEGKELVEVKRESQQLIDAANYKQPKGEDDLSFPDMDEDVQVEVVYKCPFCLIIFDEPKQLISHLTIHNSPAKVEQDSSPENDKPKLSKRPLKLRDKTEEKKRKQSAGLQESKSSPQSNKNSPPSKRAKTGYQKDYLSPERLEYDQDNSIKYADLYSSSDGEIKSPPGPKSKKRKVPKTPSSKKIEKMQALKVEQGTQPNCQFKLGKGFSEKTVPNSYLVGNHTPIKDESTNKCAYCRKNFKLPNTLWKHLIEMHPGKVKKRKE